MITRGEGGQKSQKINDVFYERPQYFISRQQKKFDIFGSFDFCQSISDIKTPKQYFSLI